MLVPLRGAAARCCLRVLLSKWCARVGACWHHCRKAAASCVKVLLPLKGAALQVALLSKCCPRFGVGVPRHGTAAGCCLRVLLLERCTPLQEGAALRVVCALCGMLVHCAVLLEGAAVRVAQRIGTGMLVPVQGAAGWCC